MELTRRRNLGLHIKAELAECHVRHADFVVEQVKAGHMTRTEAIEELQWLHEHGALNDRHLLRTAGALLPVEGTGVTQW